MKFVASVYFTLFVYLSCFGVPDEILRIAEATTKEISRAEFNIIAPQHPRAVLVLVPGYNGDGKTFLNETNWTAFARRQNWALVAVSFSSPVDLLKKNEGYYAAGKESGKMLFSALDKAGIGGLPLFLFGFSGGARFVSSLTINFPAPVAGWAAHAPCDSEEGIHADGPPGIVACGADDFRLGASLSRFQRHRKRDWPVTWIELPGNAHARSPAFEDFVRAWFTAEVSRRKNRCAGVWCDLGNGLLIKEGDSISAKVNRAWFPHEDIYRKWKAIVSDMEKPVVRYRFRTKIQKYPTMTLFLTFPPTNVVQGVFCLSLLANRPDDVEWTLRRRVRQSNVGAMLSFAEKNGLAIVAWGAPRGLWRPHYNWDGLDRDESKSLDRVFDNVAHAWRVSMDKLSERYGFPRSGYLMAGFSGAAQFAQRLALHTPESFASVAIHVSSSYDYPVESGRNILWCVTTGENENGYERSLEFLVAARKNNYSIVYKAYPGLGHTDSSLACALALAVFRHVLKSDGEGGRRIPTGAIVADVINQRIVGKDDMIVVPEPFKIELPTEEIAQVWAKN